MICSIVHAKTKTILFEGHFNNDKDCLEAAIQENVNLDYADLSSKNLSQANLDGLQISHGDFHGSNLQGCNISEASIRHCRFDNANMISSCLAESDIQSSYFHHTEFGANITTDLNLESCRFSGLSFANMRLSPARRIKNCGYQTNDNTILLFSKTPIVIEGAFDVAFILFDHHCLIGHRYFPIEVFHRLHPWLLTIRSAEGLLQESC